MTALYATVKFVFGFFVLGIKRLVESFNLKLSIVSKSLQEISLIYLTDILLNDFVVEFQNIIVN